MPPSLAEVSALTHPVFSELPGYRLSHQARNRAGLTESSYVYGETLLEPFHALVASVAPAEGEVFVDLGAGLGIAAVYAALLFPFKCVLGFELLPDLFEASKEAVRRLEAAGSLPGEAGALGKIDLRQASLLEADFAAVDVVYVMTAVFEESLLAALSVALSALRPGARVLAVGTALEHPRLKLVRWTPYATGWGASQAYVYRAGA